MKRPLPFVLCFLCAGILIGQYLFSIVGIVLFFALAFLICLYIFVKDRYAPIFATLIFSVLAVFLTRNSLLPKSLAVEGLVNQTVAVTGKVADVGYTRSGYLKIILSTSQFEGREKIPAKMRIIAYLRPNDSVRVGETVALRGNLLPLEKKRTHGGYDEFSYLRSRKVEYKMLPNEVELIHTAKESLHHEIKYIFSSIFDETLPIEEAGIAKAVILGDRSTIGNETKDLYKDSGIYHLLAISGLHISILALALSRIFNVLLNERASALVVLAILCVYCIFTGSSVSTVRAVVMFGVYAFGLLLFKESDLISSTAFACIMLLLYEPLYLFDVGFQLSFSSVFGIAYISESLSRFVSGLIKKEIKQGSVLETTVSTASVLLGNSPVVCAYTYFFTPYALLANIIILPTASVIVAFGALVCFVGSINSQLPFVFSKVIFYMLGAYKLIAQLFVSLAFSKILTGRPPILFFIAYYVLVGAFVYWQSSGNTKVGFKRKCFFLALAGFLGLMSVSAILPKPFELGVLDGSGQRSFVITKGGSATLINLGDEDYINNVDVYLNYRGINKIDCLIFTDLNAVYMQSALELVEKRNIEKIYVAADIDEGHKNYTVLNFLAEKYKITLEKIDEGSSIFPSNDFELRANRENKDLFVSVIHKGNTIDLNKKIFYNLGQPDIALEKNGTVILRLSGEKIYIKKMIE